MSRSTDYTVHIKTGDKKFAGTNADVFITFFHGKKVSKPIELDVKFRKDFKRGQTDTFRIKDSLPATGQLSKIGLTRNRKGVSPDWFVDVVDIEDGEAKTHYIFPVHRWVEVGQTIIIKHLDTVLPQNDEHSDQRVAELVAKRERYEYAVHKDGLPVMVKRLPKDEEFSDEFKFDVAKELFDLTLPIARLLFSRKPDELTHIEELYETLQHDRRPTGMEHWREDAWFGLQRVMSCNPVVIKLCREIPENFGVTANMVQPFLQGNTLSAALQTKKIYICDLKILEGVPGNGDFKVCQPLALFFVNSAGDLMPIAIQLFQEKGPNNPVFLPSDDENVWLLAKMWYNVADSCYHQTLAHLAFTHLKAEGIAVCTHRNLSPSHPLFRLLAPHFLHLMAINDAALKFLLTPGGPIDQTISIGVSGFYKLIGKRAGKFRLNVEGHLPNDLKERGVDDTGALPFYPYRDDALLTWDAIRTYVEKNVDLFYGTNAEIQGDTELQKWAKELTAPVDEDGIGMKGVPGDGKFDKKEDLVEALTCIIFKCSVRHAAVNFSQYDDYAFTPNYPSHLRGNPPTDKKPMTEKDLVDALPTKLKTIQIIAVAKLLSTPITKALGDFEVQYLYGARAQQIAKEFREDLERVGATIEQRNRDRKHRYDILEPRFIPNSISI